MSEGRLQKAELFMLTENVSFEIFFYEANSASPDLHSISLILHKADIRGDLAVHVIHVAGTCT